MSPVVHRSSLYSSRFWAAVVMAAGTGVSLGFGPHPILIVRATPALTVIPTTIELDGPGAGAQLVATLRMPDSTMRDVTAEIQIRASDACVTVGESAYIRAQRDGTTTLSVEHSGQQATVTVSVRRAHDSSAISFRRDVVAALSAGGCSQGACHGTPSGKNGFALSLRGSDPAADYRTLTRDSFGRRTGAADAEANLLLRKGTGVVAHDGGVAWRSGGVPAERVRHWLTAGCMDDPPSLPAVARLEILPGSHLVSAPRAIHSLAVHAHFADGTMRDVTRLTAFSSSRPDVADVGETGRITFSAVGEATIIARYLDAMQIVHCTSIEIKPDFAWSSPPEANEVDRLLFAKLRQMQITPARLCSDTTFLRRATLDLTGALPTPAQARAFLHDPSPHKRERAIDQLLNSPQFADFWALKWADVLRVNRKSMHAKGAIAVHEWLRSQIAANAPFDEMAKQLLTASGSSALVPAANFYRVVRDPSQQSEAIAQLFCGVRLQCAKCHNHPSDRWTQDDYAAMSAYFAQVRIRPDPTQPPAKDGAPVAEVVYLDRSAEVAHPRTGKPVAPRPLGGAAAPSDGDRRAALADWLTAPSNPYFARSLVNRTWFHLFGRGLVDPVDDFRQSNPPTHPELLDALARDLAHHHYDLRRLLRLIMNSSAYQLDTDASDSRSLGDLYFARAVPRLLTAEQLLDAVSDVLEAPERFSGSPPNRRAVQLPDGDPNHPFLKAFGQPARELPCECERSEEGNIAQALQLMSGPVVHAKLREPGNRIGRLLQSKLSAHEIVEELTLACFGRLPRPSEIQAAQDHLTKSDNPRKGMEDLVWAYLNSPEFLFRR